MRTYMLQYLIPVEYAEQSAAYVHVDDRATFNALEEIDRWGLTLVGHAHLHLARGPSGTTPSSIDRDFQSRLEQGKHIAVGSIFTPDGFIGFFGGDDLRFEIVALGHQIQEVRRNVLRIEMGNR